MRRAIVVIGKAPIAGAAKTRLAPPLSPAEAADLYRGFLLDTVELALSLEWDRTWLVHPRGDGPLLRRVLPEGRVRLLEQPRSGLGDALATTFERAFADGCESVILIGSDNPTLGPDPVLAAHTALVEHEDVALGPSADGGYYLIGMRRPHVGLFQNIEWSTPRVYAQTLERARALGLRVHSVREWYDVDHPADLHRLQRDLDGNPPEVAPHTRAALQRIGLFTSA